MRNKWIEALRSGEFKQGVGALETDEGYCCLGVACKVYEREAGKELEHPVKSAHPLKSADNLMLFPEVIEAMGLFDGIGSFKRMEIKGTPFYTLTGLNDNAGYTFEQIADVIASEPEGLFIK